MGVENVAGRPWLHQSFCFRLRRRGRTDATQRRGQSVAARRSHSSGLRVFRVSRRGSGGRLRIRFEGRRCQGGGCAAFIISVTLKPGIRGDVCAPADPERPKMTETDFERLAWLVSHWLTWRGRGLQQPATGGRSRCFSVMIFRLSFCKTLQFLRLVAMAADKPPVHSPVRPQCRASPARG